MSNESIEECLRVCRNIWPEWGGTHPETYDELMAELAALRANQLDPKIVEAVRAYQRVWLELDAIAPGIELRFSPDLQALQVLMEADAKAGGAR